MNELLTASTTDDDPADLVGRCGRVLEVFDERTQDSGNVSWSVQTGDGDLFVKTAGRPVTPSTSPPALSFTARCARLRNAVELARSCRHPALAELRNVIESPAGPLVVYDRAPGELIGGSQAARDTPGSAYQRFGQLPAARLLPILGELLDLHGSLAEVGWVASDLYDSCLIVDFATDRLTVIDLDEYRRGPGLNTMGRMFGSGRFMAPEEFTLGAPIDERTTVFTLGRLVWHFATRLTERATQFCGSDRAREVVERATSAEREDRYPDVATFLAAWRRSGA